MKTVKEIRDFFNALSSDYDKVPLYMVRKKTRFMFDDEISFTLSQKKGRFDGNVTDETFLIID